MNTIHADQEEFDEFSYVEADAARLELKPPFLSVKRQSFATDWGEELSAVVWGESAAQAVFLHGAGLNGHSWDSTILALGGPAIAFDLPGHGDSAWRDSAEYDPRSISIPLASVIAGLDAAPQVLVGQSLGGLAGIAIAKILGPRISHLVIVDVTPGHRVVGAPNSKISEFIAGPESYASRAEVIERALAFGIGSNAEDLKRGVQLNTRIRPDGRVIFKHHLATLPVGAYNPSDAPSLWKILEELEIPVLLVCGSDGILSADQKSEFTTRMPNSSVLTLEAGHNVQRDAPQALAEAIATFVREAPQPAKRTS